MQKEVDLTEREEKRMSTIKKEENTIKNVLKKVIAIALCVCMVFAIPQDVEAASKNAKQRGCTFDLKKGKKIEFHTKSMKFGEHTSYATLKSVKISKAKKKGYKQAKITLVLDNNYQPEDMKALYNLDETNYKYEVVPDWAWHVIDYKTGDNLNVSNNKYKVSVKAKGYYNVKLNKEGNMMYEKFVITITYPKNYTGLCFGFGEWSYLNQQIKPNPHYDPAKDEDGDKFIFIEEEDYDEETGIGITTGEQVWPYEVTKTSKYANKYVKADNKYWKGKTSFFKTGYYHYKYIRNNTHFIRIK